MRNSIPVLTALALDRMRRALPAVSRDLGAAQATVALPPSERFEEGTYDILSPGLTPGAEWRLRRDSEVITAVMDDHDFQRRVAKREVVFGSGDRIRATLSTISWSGAGRPGVVRKIIAVHELLASRSDHPET